MFAPSRAAQTVHQRQHRATLRQAAQAPVDVRAGLMTLCDAIQVAVWEGRRSDVSQLIGQMRDLSARHPRPVVQES